MFRRYLELPRTVFLLCLGALVNRAGAMVLPFLVLYLTESRGFGPAAASQIMGAFGLGSIFASMLGGALADRIGRRPVMVASLLGGAIAISVVPRVEGELAAFAAVFALSLASEAYRPAASAMLSDIVSPELRPRAYAMFYAAMNLGFTVGASLGGWLVVATSYDVLFTIEAISGLAFAAFIAWVLPETRPAAAPPTEDATSAAAPGAVAHILRNRAFLVFLLASWLIMLLFAQSFTTLPLYMHRIGIPPDVYGRVMAVNGTMIVLGQLPLTDRLSRHHNGHTMVIGALFMAAGFGLTGAFTTAAGMVFTVVLWTIGEMYLATVTQAVVADLAPLAYRARYFGAFTATTGMAMAFGPPAGGWVLEAYGPRWLWGGAGAAAISAALMLWAIRRQLRQAEVAAVERAAEAEASA